MESSRLEPNSGLGAPPGGVTPGCASKMGFPPLSALYVLSYRPLRTPRQEPGQDLQSKGGSRQDVSLMEADATPAVEDQARPLRRRHWANRARLYGITACLLSDVLAASRKTF